jgi:hypothetical protein
MSTGKKPVGMSKAPEGMPVILCEAHEGEWRFFCPYCRRWHTHSPEPGHRVAHCGNLRSEHPSPFLESGYWLVKL